MNNQNNQKRSSKLSATLLDPDGDCPLGQPGWVCPTESISIPYDKTFASGGHRKGH